MEATLVRSGDKSIVVHAWDLGRRGGISQNPNDHIPKEFVTHQSQGLRLAYHGTPKWHYIQIVDREVGEISVAGDLLEADLKAVAVYAMEFQRMIRDEIAGPHPSRPYRIRIVRDRKEFDKYAASRQAYNAMSFYDPRDPEIALWFNESMTHDELQELVAHEFTHAYMDLVYGRTSPLWFAEGMAEYFQHFTWEGYQAVGGAVNEKQLRILQMNDPIPLSEFVIVPREVMYQPSEFPRLYAQAWSVVHFLFKNHPETITGLLFGQRLVDANLESAWREHLEALYSG